MLRDKDGTYQESPVHVAFGLTYSAYFCVPRLVLEAMPLEWQTQFVALVEKLPDTPTYECRIRGEQGRFQDDPLRDYRRGSIPEHDGENRVAGMSDVIRLALAAALVMSLDGCAHREPLGRAKTALGTKEGWATAGAVAGAAEAALRFDIYAWRLIWPAPETKP